ncbi:MAG: acyl-CoA thioesterase [Candidatus Fermentibacteraceae bacterium]|nr:acyl-CoA thioesterase [Candidatus Fermentibacteraceae bacterium]MBN2608476.1 acyl-CoA thioesterase [Candidatus Fermentibacteraceae bacterium]
MNGRMEGSGQYRGELTVPEEAIDRNGHVNNVVYIQWMQEVAVLHSEASGGTRAMEEAGGTWVVRSHSIEYLRPAFSGDRIEICTWVANMHRVRSLRKYEFVRIPGGEPLARGETDWVFLDSETGRPSAIPKTVSDCFRIFDR